MPKAIVGHEQNERKEQVKDAISKMLRAGFERRTFSVRSTEWRPGFGRRHCPPRIILHCEIDYTIERLPDLLLADFKVTLVCLGGTTLDYAEINWMHHSREPHLEIGFIEDFGAEMQLAARRWMNKG